MAGFDRYDDSRTMRHDRDRERGFEREDRGRGGSMFGGGRTDYDRQRGQERGFGRDRDDRNERQFGSDDYRQGLPIDETGRLIASNKVEGTAVYGRDDERLGSIYNFMVDKFSGKVEYAVMTYGGFLGMGTRYYPLPWRTLSYDTRRGGYRIDLAERDLKNAPSFDRDSEPEFNRNYGERVHGWYGLSY